MIKRSQTGCYLVGGNPINAARTEFIKLVTLEKADQKGHQRMWRYEKKRKKNQMREREVDREG